MSKFSSPFMAKSPFNNKRGRIHHEDIAEDKKTAEADDFTTRKVNDPKKVLNRDITKTEHKKGYKYKEEKDGSLTLRGRRGPLKQKDPKSTFGGKTDTPDQVREEEATNQLMDEGKITETDNKSQRKIRKRVKKLKRKEIKAIRKQNK